MIAGHASCPHLPAKVALVKLAGRVWVKPEVSGPHGLWPALLSLNVPSSPWCWLRAHHVVVAKRTVVGEQRGKGNTGGE